MFGIGMSEIIVIMIVAIIVLGPKRLPEAVKQMAKFFREIKSTVDEVKSSVVSEIEDIKSLPEDLTKIEDKKEEKKFEEEFEKEVIKPKYSEDYEPKREKISFKKEKKEDIKDA